MSSLRKALVLLLLHVLFAADNRRSYGHSLLQLSSPRSEFNCTLTSEQLKPYRLDEGRWIITDSGLEALEGDIQSLVNCTKEADVLLFDIEAPVRPSRRTTIPWNLTLSAFVEDARMEDGTFKEAMRKVTFWCSRQDEGAFFVEASESLFANFAFRSCSLNSRSEGARRGIITIANCSRSRNSSIIALHHVDFEDNVLHRSAALCLYEPSCSSVQMLHVRFRYNLCPGICAAHLPSQSELQNIALTGNRFFEDDFSDHVLIALESGSNATIDGLIASENDGIAVRVRGSNVRISNSHIFQNSGRLGQDGYYHTGGLSFISSSGEILDSRFEENSGYIGASLTVGDSNIVIKNTTVIGCTSKRRGGGISITRFSNVSILDSVIANNSAKLSGGGVDSYGANRLRIENTSFEMNSAETGAGLYFFSGALTVRNSKFTKNRATRSGGGGYIRMSSYSLTNLTVIRNKAVNGGGLALWNSHGSLVESYFQRNSVRGLGGGLQMSWLDVSVVHNCIFANNSAPHGGGIMSTGSEFRGSGVQFQDCSARVHGGGVMLNKNSSFQCTGCLFERNSAEQEGSAIRMESETPLLNVFKLENTIFRNNSVASDRSCGTQGSQAQPIALVWVRSGA